MKAIVIFLVTLTIWFAPLAARSYETEGDGSVQQHSNYFAQKYPDVRATRAESTKLVLYTPTIKNPDGTLPPPFWVTPLFKSILDDVLKPMSPNGGVPTIMQWAQAALRSAVLATLNVLDPAKQVEPAKAALTAAGQQSGDSAGGAAKDNAAGAIDFCSRYLKNFASDGANRWNKVRDAIFLPIAILLLLPGAVLAQVKAIASAGNPVLGNVNPFEGILRSVVAIFMIPGTYLVISFGIDFSNCITFTISDQYTRLFGSNMYKDALCGQMRAMPTNGPSASAGSGQAPPWPQSPDLESQNFGNGSPDPCGGVPADNAHVNEAMPAHVVYSRLAVYGANAASTTAWNILCAFQMAYLCYLFLVGPIVAALWVWPIKQMRDALPSWIEGVITLCFWSLFWNTTILLMACFKDYGTTGTYIFTALNFLATSCVKYAFDFGGLVAAAGQEAAQKATQPAQGGGAGGAGAHGGQGKATANLPPGAKPFLGADGKMHYKTTDAAGHQHEFTYDPSSKIWNPDDAALATAGGMGAGGAGGGGAGGDGSANPIMPVTDVNHPPPPLSGKPGVFDTIIPGSGGEHLRVTTGADGQQHWAVYAPGVNPSDPNAKPLMSGDIAAGQPFTISDGHGLADTISVTNGANGSQDLKFTDAAGHVLGDQVFNGAGQTGYTTIAPNGDSVTVTNLGNGLEAVSVTNAKTGEVDTAVVVAGTTANSLNLNGDKIDLNWTNGNLASLSISTTDPTTGQASVDKYDFSTASGAMQVTESVDGKVVGQENLTQTGAGSWSLTAQDASGNTRTDEIVNGIDTAKFFNAQGQEVASQTYDSSGALTSTTVFNSDGSVQVSTPDGDTKLYAPDSNGSYTETKVDAAGNQILSGTMTVDANGNETYTSTSSSYTIDPATGNAVVNGTVETTQHFDGHGALIDSTNKSYDANHNLTGETDITRWASGDTSGYTAVQKDASGQVVQTDSTIKTASTGVTSETLTTYDAHHNPVDVKTVSTDQQGKILSQSDVTTNYENGVPLVYSSSANSQTIGLQGGDAVTQISDGHGGQQFTFTNNNGNIVATIDVNASGNSGTLANGDPCTVTTTGTGGYAITDQKTGETYTVNAVNGSGEAAPIAYSNGYQATITSGGGGAAPEQFNFVDSQQPSSFVQQGGVNTYTNSGGWAALDTQNHTITFGNTPDQPQLQISFDNTGAEYVQVGDQKVQIPAQYNDGNPHQIQLSNGNIVTYSQSPTDHSQTFSVKGSSYTLAADNNVVINGKQGNISSSRLHSQAASVANNGFFGAGLFGSGAIKNAPIVKPAPKVALADAVKTNSNSDKTNNGTPGGADSNSYLFKDSDVDDSALEIFGLDEVNDSLQDQMMKVGSHLRNTGTINSVLRKSYGGNTRPEAVVAATVDQNVATIYCGQGKYGQAEELYRNALKTMEKYTDAPEYGVLLETYANFLDRQGRSLEGDLYRAKLLAVGTETFVTATGIVI